MYDQKNLWFPGLSTFPVDSKEWRVNWAWDEVKIFGWLAFLGKVVGRWSSYLTRSSSNPLVGSEKGSSPVQNKLCWWVTEEIFKPGLSCQELCQMVKRHLQVWTARVRSSNHYLVRPEFTARLVWNTGLHSEWNVGLGLLCGRERHKLLFSSPPLA